MFKIITVEREYGAGGSMVAAELARRKGWQLVDQEITEQIAKLASVDSRVVARCEEKCDTLMHRLAKVFWRGSYERLLPIADDKIFNADTVVHLAQKVIEEKAKHGHCVIVGRGAPYILRNRRDTFRVFVFGWLLLRRVALTVALVIVPVCCGGALAQSLGSAVPASELRDVRVFAGAPFDLPRRSHVDRTAG